MVSPERVGLGLTAHISVRLGKHADCHKRSPMAAFTAAVQAWPEVVECAALTGEMDSLLKHPSVQDWKSSFVPARPATWPE